MIQSSFSFIACPSLVMNPKKVIAKRQINKIKRCELQIKGKVGNR